MSTTVQPQMRPVADVVITVLMLALFGWGLWASLEWSFRASLFPRMVTTAGLGLTVMHLVMLLVRTTMPGLSWPANSVSAASGGDDEVEVQELEYEFAHASRRTWVINIGWVVAFFGGVFVLGLFLTSIFFTLAYLRFGAERSWWYSGIYAAILAAVLLVFFDQMLSVSMPLGVVQS